MHTSPLDTPGRGDAGGLTVMVLNQAKQLASRGYDVEIITRRTCVDCPEIEKLEYGLNIRRLTAGPPRILPKSQIDTYCEEFSNQLAKLVPYDLIHSHHWMSGVAALPVARKWQIAHLQSFHSVAAHPHSPLREGEPPESPARIDGEKYVAQHSDLIVAVSHAEAATVIGRCGADPQRVIIIKPGVDIKMFHPAAGEIWAPPGVMPGYLLFAARLQPLKGADLALAAVGLLPEKIRPQLVIAGETSEDFADYAKKLDQIKQQMKLDDVVVRLPSQNRKDFAKLIRHATISLVPSHSETFGLIALEAQASGVPVIASAAGGLTEAIDDQVTGWLIDSRDPDEWAKALVTLLSDEQLRSELGKQGRIRAMKETWSAAAIKLSNQYQRFLY